MQLLSKKKEVLGVREKRIGVEYDGCVVPS